MALNILAQQVIDALWVFDSFVVVRFTSNQISFYEKPLIRGYTESPMTINLNNVTIGLDYQTFEFGRNDDNATECYLFGVAGS
jgi:hypothetical protein